MRKEKDVNCVARRRNKPDYCPSSWFNRKKTHYSQPVLSLALNFKYARPQHMKFHTCVYDKTWYVSQLVYSKSWLRLLSFRI